MPSLRVSKLKKLKLMYEDNMAELTRSVGTTRYKLEATPSFAETATVEVLGRTIDLAVEASAGALIHAAGHELRPFGDASTHKAPADHSFAELHVKAGLGAETKFSAPLKAIAVDVKASAGTQAEYHHIVPVFKADKRIDALRKVVEGGRPVPKLLDLRRVARNGEIHVYDAWINVDFGLSARYDARFSLSTQLEPFNAVPSTTIKAHVELTAKAGMGWAMYRKARIVVAPSLDESKWLRARIEKKKRQKLSLSAGLDLKASYDAAKPLEAILDHALELDPVVDVIEALERVAEYAGKGGWSRVKTTLEKRLAEEIAEFVEDSGWREWAARSNPAMELVSFSKKLVGSWQGFESAYQERVRTIWNELLGATDLGPNDGLRRAIETISKINPERLDIKKLLNEEGAEIVALVETVTGDTIEELVLTGRVETEIGRAVAVAKRITKALNTGLTDLVEKLEKLQEKSGINSIVAFLEKHATSMQKLEQAIDEQVRPRIKRLAEKLTDKVWTEINDTDVEKIQRWAKKMKGVLSRKEAWERNARERIAKLRGEAGFSISLEFERLTERTAVLDLEFNPSDGVVLDAVKSGLSDGDILGLLSQLPDQDDDEIDEVKESNWLIREGVFSTVKRRCGAISVLSSLSGRRRRVSELTQEAEVRIKSRRRTATYGVRYARRFEMQGMPVFEASAAWTANAAGQGHNLVRAYDEVRDEMRLQFIRFDNALVAREIAALDSLMTGFGFAAGEERPIESAVRATLRGDLPRKLDARFILVLKLPEQAINAFLTPNQTEWDRHLLNAAHRWYTEDLIDRPSRRDSSVQVGDLMAAVLKSEIFQANWTRGSGGLGNKVGNREMEVAVGNKLVPVALMYRTSGLTRLWRFEPQFGSLERLLFFRKRSWENLDEAYAAHKSAVESGLPAHLLHAVKKMGRAFKVNRGSKQWPNPAFLPWLVLACGAELGEMPGATGVASLRWRLAGSEADYNVHFWELDGSLRDLAPIFPFRRGTPPS